MTNSYFYQESERLIYRRLTKDDIPSWYDFFIDNNRLEYLGIDSSIKHKEIAEEWILFQMERNNKNGLGHLAVELKETRELIGLSGILTREINDQKEYEISYSLKPAFWNKGYGTEMAKQMRRYGSNNLELNRFISIIHKDNKSSITVAIKNGMVELFETEFRDMPVFVYGDKMTK